MSAGVVGVGGGRGDVGDADFQKALHKNLDLIRQRLYNGEPPAAPDSARVYSDYVQGTGGGGAHVKKATKPKSDDLSRWLDRVYGATLSCAPSTKATRVRPVSASAARQRGAVPNSPYSHNFATANAYQQKAEKVGKQGQVRPSSAQLSKSSLAVRTGERHKRNAREKPQRGNGEKAGEGQGGSLAEIEHEDKLAGQRWALRAGAGSAVHAHEQCAHSHLPFGAQDRGKYGGTGGHESPLISPLSSPGRGESDLIYDDEDDDDGDEDAFDEHSLFHPLPPYGMLIDAHICYYLNLYATN